MKAWGRGSGGRILVAVVIAATALTTASHGVSAGTSRANYFWPELHKSPDLSGHSSDPAISTSTASTLGVKWMSPIGGTESSPIVAWNSSLDEPLVFTGNTAGYFDAVDADSGTLKWSVPFSSPIVSTPIVDGNSVWVPPESSGHIYKLDAATGAVQCSAPVATTTFSSPVIATPPGGSRTIYIGSDGEGPVDGLVYAFATSNCSTVFTWNGYTTPGQDTGVWSPIGYNVDATGQPLVLFGSANPDSSVYAINALTGATVWTFDTDNPSGLDWDVGAGVDTTAPGVNGFADGVAYVVGKNGSCYALNLTTGALIWSFDFGHGASTDALSTAALAGGTLVFGDDGDILAFDAVTGQPLWTCATGDDDVNSSPAIVGPAGGQVVAFGTVGGKFHVLSLATGALLYTYQTGSFISASPAESDGTLLVNSNDGYLYDFGLGGGNGSGPTTTVTSPASNSTVRNPDGRLTVSGTATATDGVSAVTVEVEQDGTTGPWYHSATKAFLPGMSFSSATLSHPGASATDWSISLPIPLAGSSYLVKASAVGTNGVADISSGGGGDVPSVSTFTVRADPTAPRVTASANRIAPGSAFRLSAAKFKPGERVRSTLPVSPGTTKTIAVVRARSTGGVGPLDASMPSDEPFGSHTITATGETSGRTGTVSVFISNNSPQLGYGPQRFGFETNDTVLENRQAIGPLLEPSWIFATSGGIDSTPAVEDGVAYVGDSQGNLYAVTIADGHGLWTTPIGSAISSSPAVDKGRVFFGDDEGTVVALNTTNGVPDWTANLGARVTSSPAVSGRDVFIVTSAGTVFPSTSRPAPRDGQCGSVPALTPACRSSPQGA